MDICLAAWPTFCSVSAHGWIPWHFPVAFAGTIQNSWFRQWWQAVQVLMQQSIHRTWYSHHHSAWFDEVLMLECSSWLLPMLGLRYGKAPDSSLSLRAWSTCGHAPLPHLQTLHTMIPPQLPFIIHLHLLYMLLVVLQPVMAYIHAKSPTKQNTILSSHKTTSVVD